MTYDEFNEALVRFSLGVADRYQEDGLNWEMKIPIGVNYPWYYVDFTARERTHLLALQALDGEYRTFCSQTGAVMDGGVSVSAPAANRINVRVKLLWNEKRKVPVIDDGHEHTPVMDADDHETYTCSIPGCGKTFTK